MPIAAADLPARSGTARVLHTSDWHLGVTVRNEPRDRDHDALIDEIVGIATGAEPDLIVHTGDMFNTARPAMSDFGRAIIALRRLAEIAPVVAIGGNHDSPIALETLGTAVSDPVPALVAAGEYDPYQPNPARIRILPRAANARNGAVATYPIPAGGRLRFVGLPFLHANRIVGDWEAILAQHSTYTDGIHDIARLLGDSAFEQFDTGADVAVFASHIHVAGARTLSEKEIHISADYATDPAHIEARYGYLAFGHIHIPQPVATNGRYAGSILQVDFGEEGEDKEVVVADLEPGRPTRIHDVELTAGRRLQRIKTPLTGLDALAGSIGDAIVEITITAEPAVADGDSTGPSGTLFNPGDGLGEHDTLSAAVAARLPGATIVAVIDARRPRSQTADEIDVPDVTESIHDTFRGWLRDHSGPLFDRHATTGAATAERVASLFDELHTAVATDADIVIGELEQVRTLDPELEI